MKEATGELSMTTITIIAVIAISLIVTLLVPTIRTWINESWSNLSSTPSGVTYVEVVDAEVNM